MALVLRLLSGERSSQDHPLQKILSGRRLLRSRRRSHWMSDIGTAVAKPALTFEQRAKAQDRRLIEPPRYELYSGRQLLRAECERHRQSRQATHIERRRGLHDVKRAHGDVVDDVLIARVAWRSERVHWAQEHVVVLEPAGEA